MKRSKTALLFGSIVFILLSSFGLLSVYLLLQSEPQPVDDFLSYFVNDNKVVDRTFKLDTFDSEEEVEEYIASYGNNNFDRYTILPQEIDSIFDLFGQDGAGVAREESAQVPGRYSETNVRTLGIDEPDILKTDGQSVFLSSDDDFLFRPVDPILFQEQETGLIAPDYYRNRLSTKIIDAKPQEEMLELASLNVGGELLVHEQVLVSFGDNGIFAYDISDPSSPSSLWEYGYQANYSLSQARRYGDDLFIILVGYLNGDDICPIEIFIDSATTVECDEIYYSDSIIGNSTTLLVRLDLGTGAVEDASISLGSNYGSFSYMSEGYTYVINPLNSNYEDLQLEAYLAIDEEVLPRSIVRDIGKVNRLDLHNESKYTEVLAIVRDYKQTLSRTEERSLEKALSEFIQDYEKEVVREIYRSGVIRVSNSDFGDIATTTVPGRLLNEFSIDEYDGNLRVATTIDSQLGNESSNDVYVFNDKLRQTGEILDLGLDERIYSARFVGDIGYLVTFRQIDPFFTIDLRDPSNPTLLGELKIPGFSSYLHPFGDKVIGIGEQDNQVKASLFDVSDLKNPVELDNLILKEFYSEIGNNHRAFLLDSDNERFFLPTSGAGYFVSLSGGELTVEKKVEINNPKRAIYIDDYFYVLGAEELIVFDSLDDWNEVGVYPLT